MSLNMHKKILIYGDLGVSKRSKFAMYKLINELFKSTHDIQIVDKTYVNTRNWLKSTDLFIMPGGYSSPHYDMLSSGGNEKIVKFVNEGGKYLGICSGAYYGSRKTEFDVGRDLEIKLSGPLNFFPGIACGPCYGPGTFKYNSEYGFRAAKVNCIKDASESIHLYSNGGCYFLGVDSFSNTKILSKYLDLKGTPPAIISCKFGQSLVVLSGVHFEYSPDDVNKNDLSNEDNLKLLKSTENKRNKFVKEIFSLLEMPCEIRV